MIGGHWKKIGFQGEVPARDIRGSGMLGIVQVMSLLKRHKRWAKFLWRHSNRKKTSFPLVVSLFGFTTFTLDLFREGGKINTIANKESNLLECFNDFYCSLVLAFFSSFVYKELDYKEYGFAKKEFKDSLKIQAFKYYDVYQKIKQRIGEEGNNKEATFKKMVMPEFGFQ